MSTSPIPSDSIHVNEVFYSVQGEGTRAGMPCLFIRLQGCRLRCSWCDTPYALDHRQQHQWMSMQDVLDLVERTGCGFVEFTGGEPLEQPAVLPIMSALCDRGYTVAVETGGHIDMSAVDPRVICIVDVKCPDSKMSTLNYLPNLEKLRPHDEVKFVLASRNDYEYARDIVKRYDLESRVAAVLMSCVFDALAFVTLVEWILEDHLNVRFQLQMHKFIWSPETRGV